MFKIYLEHSLHLSYVNTFIILHSFYVHNIIYNIIYKLLLIVCLLTLLKELL